MKGVRQIVATSGAFAALLEDGSVVTWGQAMEFINVLQGSTCNPSYLHLHGLYLLLRG